MEIMDYAIKAGILALIVIVCASWLIYFSIKTFSKHTDFGRRAKKENKKRDAVHESTDDVPDLKYVDAPFLATKPKIETSFGDTRIGDIYEET